MDLSTCVLGKSRRRQPGSRPEDFAWAMKALRNVCGLPKNDPDRSSLRWQKENQKLKGADELVGAAQRSETRRGGAGAEEGLHMARRRIIGTETYTVDIFRER